jgi:hypothetical protein
MIGNTIPPPEDPVRAIPMAKALRLLKYCEMIEIEGR